MYVQPESLIEAKDRFLTFSLGQITYGVPIVNVLEIIGVGTITSVPGMPDYIIGLVNMRGKVIPLMDLRVRLRKTPRDYDERTCVIVVKHEALTVGLVVDKAESVLEIKEEDMSPIPNGKLGFEAQFLLGAGRKNNDIQLLINVERLI